MVVQKEVEVYLYSFSNLGTKLGWLVKATPLQIYILERDSIPTVQGTGWVSGPVLTCVEHLPPTGIRSPDRPGSIIRVHTGIYRVSQEESARIRENVPYVELHRYDPKHLYSKLNVTEIMAREMCGLLAVPRTVPVKLTRYPYTAPVRPWEWNAANLATGL
jgi:hypothetical protein